MDFTTPRYFQAYPNSSALSSLVNGEPPLERNSQSFYAKTQKNDIINNKNGSNPFAETFPDPLCNLNLKETSEFVKSFPIPENARGFPRRESTVSSVNMSQKRLVVEPAPPTPGRPVFGFSSSGSYPGNSLQRKSVPSKWDDAEKWLINSSSCHDSPAHTIKSSEHSIRISNNNNNSGNGFKPSMEVFSDKSRVIEENVSSKAVPNNHNSSSVRGFNGVLGSSDVLFLKDKFTDDTKRSIGNSTTSEAPSKVEALLSEAMRDVGTEMTPLGSSTTSLCPTPVKSLSPARHNTPADRSGPLGLAHSDTTTSTSIDIAHFANLDLFGNRRDANWSSREEEEEEVSKSLRHFEFDAAVRCNNFGAANYNHNHNHNHDHNHHHVGFSNSHPRVGVWEEEDKTKCCSRYQREEAKIQAWVNLQNAKAEAQSRKLEVKIQKMRSNLEEKLMKRMAVVHRKAEEWRESARQQHSDQLQKATQNGHKMSNINNNNNSRNYNSSFSLNTTTSCGCFPCNNNNHYRS